MNHSTIDLLTRKLYGRSIPEAEATAELSRRGWPKPVCFAVVLALFPLVMPERVICELGGDNWDEPTTWKDVVFSIAYSQYMIMPFIALYGLFIFIDQCAGSACRLGSFPYISTSLFLASLVITKKLHDYWK